MKTFLTTALCAVTMTASVAYAELPVTTLEKLATDAVKAEATKVVEEKKAEVQKEATKKVISETAKTTANSVGVTGQDEVIEKTVDRGVDLYDENKEKIGAVKEQVETVIGVDKTTDTLTIKETVETVITTDAPEGVVEKGLSSVEGAEAVTKAVKEIEDAIPTNEKSAVEGVVDGVVESLEPAAGEGSVATSVGEVETAVGETVKAVEGVQEKMNTLAPEAGTVQKTEEKEGVWNKIKGLF